MNEHYTPINKSAADIKRDIQLFKRFSNESNSIESIRTRGVLNRNKKNTNWSAFIAAVLFYGSSVTFVIYFVYFILNDIKP